MIAKNKKSLPDRSFRGRLGRTALAQTKPVSGIGNALRSASRRVRSAASSATPSALRSANKSFKMGENDPRCCQLALPISVGSVDSCGLIADRGCFQPRRRWQSPASARPSPPSPTPVGSSCVVPRCALANTIGSRRPPMPTAAATQIKSHHRPCDTRWCTTARLTRRLLLQGARKKVGNARRVAVQPEAVRRKRRTSLIDFNSRVQVGYERV